MKSVEIEIGDELFEITCLSYTGSERATLEYAGAGSEVDLSDTVARTDALGTKSRITLDELAEIHALYHGGDRRGSMQDIYDYVTDSVEQQLADDYDDSRESYMSDD